jgi:hypothetical protein
MRGQELSEWLAKQEIHSPNYMVGSLRVYLDISITEALQSENPFIKALAIVDRRVGKRTLERMNPAGAEHSLVKSFYELRYDTLHV